MLNIESLLLFKNILKTLVHQAKNSVILFTFKSEPLILRTICIQLNRLRIIRNQKAYEKTV
jgi:hypothetical protein